MVGRNPLNVKKIGVKVRIPEHLHARVNLLLLDPLRGKVQYGNWTNLMTKLLEAWVLDQTRNMNDG